MVYLAKALRSDTIESEHLLLAIIKDESGLSQDFCQNWDRLSVVKIVETDLPEVNIDFWEDEEGPIFNPPAEASSRPIFNTKEFVRYSGVDNFGIDLTRQLKITV